MGKYDGFTKAKLYVECAKRGIKGFQSKSEAELIKLLETTDGAASSSIEETKAKMSKKVAVPKPAIDDDDVELIEPVEEVTEVPKTKRVVKPAKEVKVAKVKVEKPAKKAKVKAEKQRATIDRDALIAAGQAPFKGSSGILWLLFKKGGTKEGIIDALVANCKKRKITLTNPSGRFTRVLAHLNSASEQNGALGKVVKNDKGKYILQL